MFVDLVRTAGVHVDGTPKAQRLLLLSSGPFREARGGVQHHAARRHHHGLLERVLRTSIVTRLLRRPAVSHGTRHDHAHDPAGSHVGPASHIHPGIVSQGRGFG